MSYVVASDCLSVVRDDGVVAEVEGVFLDKSQLVRVDEEAVLRGVLVLKPVLRFGEGWTTTQMSEAKEAWIDAVRPLAMVSEEKGLAASTGRVYISKHGIPSIRVGKTCWVNRNVNWRKS